MTGSTQSAKQGRVLVAGGTGMLGIALCTALRDAGFEVISASRIGADVTLDISNAQSCARAVFEVSPDVVVNCAAAANVDWCEEHADEAFAVNAQGAGNLAAATARTNARFIHFSTDYVFNGAGTTPFAEDAPTDPINVYGKSKLEGERNIARVMTGRDGVCVLRVCALFGCGGRNFVDTIAGKVLAGERLRVVNDQITRPTAATEVAAVLARALKDSPHSLEGVFHVAAQGWCSWHEFACAICTALGRSPEEMVAAVSSAEFVRPAARPAFAVFDTGKFARVFGFEPDGWRGGLNKYMAQHYARML